MIAGATGCQQSGNTNANTAVSVNTAPANTNGVPPSSNAVTEASSDAGKPTEAYKAAYAARKGKDVAALKKLMSKELLDFLTEMGQIGDKKQTLDQVLIDSGKEPKTDETRNEKIVGNRATVEFKDDDDTWEVMDFVKEDGIWKLTLPQREDGGIDDDADPKSKGK